LAGRSQDAATSLAEVVHKLVRFDRSFEPDVTRSAYYEDRFGKYLELYKSLVAFNSGF
jgi:hypothetical protein